MSADNSHLRVVFDCMIYLQATVSETGPAAALMRLADEEAITLFVNHNIITEVREVLSRPSIRQRNAALSFYVGLAHGKRKARKHRRKSLC